MRVKHGISSLFLVNRHTDCLVGTTVPLIPFLLSFRSQDQADKAMANSIADMAGAGDALRQRAADTLDEPVPDPDRRHVPAVPSGGEPITDDDVTQSVGHVFQRVHPAPGLEQTWDAINQAGLNRSQSQVLLKSRDVLVLLVHGPRARARP